MHNIFLENSEANSISRIRGVLELNAIATGFGKCRSSTRERQLANRLARTVTAVTGVRRLERFRRAENATLP
jgi:hypothetical protein